MSWEDDLTFQSGMQDWMGTGQLQPPAPVQMPPPQTMAPPPQMAPPPMPMAGQARGIAGPMLQQAQQAGQAQKQAGLARFDAEQTQQRAMAEQMGPAYTRDEELYKADMQKKADAEIEFNSRQNAFKQRVSTLAAEDVDPMRVVNNMETWQKIALGVSMAIGGFLNPKGKNHSAELILEYIDRDVKAQEFNQNRKMKALGAEQDMASQDMVRARQAFEDGEAHRLHLIELAKRQAAIEAVRNGSPVAQAARDQLSAELDAKAFDIVQDATKGLLTYDASIRATNQQAHEAKQRLEFDKSKLAATTAVDLAKIAVDQTTNTDANNKRYGIASGKNFLPVVNDGQMLGFVPKGQHQETSEWLRAADGAKAAAEAITLSQSKRDWWADRPDLLARLGLGSDEHITAEEIYAQLVKHTRIMEGSGKAWTGNEEKNVYRQITKGAGGWLQEDPTTRLRAFVNSIESDRKRLLGTFMDENGQPAYPYQPTEAEQFGLTPTGMTISR